MKDSDISWPVAKALSLWAAIGITSWADFASFVAGMYSLVLICEWFWKKIGRGLAVRWGWIKDGQ